MPPKTPIRSEKTYVLLDKPLIIEPELEKIKDYIYNLLLLPNSLPKSHAFSVNSLKDVINGEIKEPNSLSWFEIVQIIKNIKAENSNDDILLGVNKLISEIEFDIQLRIEKKNKSKLKYNLIIISPLVGEHNWTNYDMELTNRIKKTGVFLNLIWFNLSFLNDDNYLKSLSEDNLTCLRALIEDSKEVLDLPLVVSRNDKSCDNELSMAMKFVENWDLIPGLIKKPFEIFNGLIRIGANLNSINIDSIVKDLEFKTGYNWANDQLSFGFSVNGYALCKRGEWVTGTTVGVNDEGDGVKVSENYYYYIQKDDETELDAENEEGDNIDAEDKPNEMNEFKIDPNNIIEGLQFGKSKLLFSDLNIKDIKVSGNKGIDIIGFIEKDKIPPWYYRGESIILFPNRNGNLKDIRMFHELCSSMLREKLVAIVKFIKREGNISLSVLIPNGFINEFSDDIDFDCFTIVEILFKDDEKLVNLPKIDIIKDKDENCPNSEMVELIDKLVDDYDLDKDEQIEIDDSSIIKLNERDSFPMKNDSNTPLISRFLRNQLNSNCPQNLLLIKNLLLSSKVLKTAKDMEGKSLFQIYNEVKPDLKDFDQSIKEKENQKYAPDFRVDTADSNRLNFDIFDVKKIEKNESESKKLSPDGNEHKDKQIKDS